MGNTIVKDDLTLNTNTDLGKIIQKWAVNDYSIHPSVKNNPRFKDSLKKRACCTNNPNIIIAMPG